MDAANHIKFCWVLKCLLMCRLSRTCSNKPGNIVDYMAVARDNRKPSRLLTICWQLRQGKVLQH